jgi:hypothetical protein
MFKKWNRYKTSYMLNFFIRIFVPFQFCVDKRIFIIGFGLYGSSSGSSGSQLFYLFPEKNLDRFKEIRAQRSDCMKNVAI